MKVFFLKNLNKPGIVVITDDKALYVLNSQDMLSSIVRTLPRLSENAVIRYSEALGCSNMRSIRASLLIK